MSHPSCQDRSSQWTSNRTAPTDCPPNSAHANIECLRRSGVNSIPSSTLQPFEKAGHRDPSQDPLFQHLPPAHPTSDHGTHPARDEPELQFLTRIAPRPSRLPRCQPSPPTATVCPVNAKPLPTPLSPLLTPEQMARVLSSRRAITSEEFQQQVARHLGRPVSPGRRKASVNGHTVWVCC